uniref:Putative secreted protein n=2 Tax=Nyssorhynchus TaxID=44543 RepID=A0A2M4B1R7_9DIPT
MLNLLEVRGIGLTGTERVRLLMLLLLLMLELVLSDEGFGQLLLPSLIANPSSSSFISLKLRPISIRL